MLWSGLAMSLVGRHLAQINNSRTVEMAPKEAGNATAFIRPVQYENDKAALDKIFRATCNPALQQEPQWTISSYLWCHPYPMLYPDACFVLDDGSGQAVGYVLSTPDTRDFATRWPTDFLPRLDKNKLPPSPNYKAQSLEPPTWDSDLPGFLLHMMYNDHIGLLNGAYPDMLDKYPAHLHIDLLPPYQGQGWGRKMVDHLTECLRSKGAKGVHLGMEKFNVGAGKFYDRLGFKRFPRVFSDEAEGRHGETASVIYLVKDLQ
jgi:GNAT superfamily N-acetyltransferase